MARVAEMASGQLKEFRLQRFPVRRRFELHAQHADGLSASLHRLRVHCAAPRDASNTPSQPEDSSRPFRVSTRWSSVHRTTAAPLRPRIRDRPSDGRSCRPSGRGSSPSPWRRAIQIGGRDGHAPDTKSPPISPRPTSSRLSNARRGAEIRQFAHHMPRDRTAKAYSSAVSVRLRVARISPSHRRDRRASVDEYTANNLRVGREPFEARELRWVDRRPGPQDPPQRGQGDVSAVAAVPKLHEGRRREHCTAARGPSLDQ